MRAADAPLCLAAVVLACMSHQHASLLRRRRACPSRSRRAGDVFAAVVMHARAADVLAAVEMTWCWPPRACVLWRSRCVYMLLVSKVFSLGPRLTAAGLLRLARMSVAAVEVPNWRAGMLLTSAGWCPVGRCPVPTVLEFSYHRLVVISPPEGLSAGYEGSVGLFVD